jgi:hypothetical protein
MAEWIENSYGARVAKVEDWEIEIRNGAVTIYEPKKDWNVYFHPEGLIVRGESDCGWTVSPENVIIPFGVLQAILEAKSFLEEGEEDRGERIQNLAQEIIADLINLRVIDAQVPMERLDKAALYIARRISMQ